MNKATLEQLLRRLLKASNVVFNCGVDINTEVYQIRQLIKDADKEVKEVKEKRRMQQTEFNVTYNYKLEPNGPTHKMNLSELLEAERYLCAIDHQASCACQKCAEARRVVAEYNHWWAHNYWWAHLKQEQIANHKEGSKQTDPKDEQDL